MNDRYLHRAKRTGWWLRLRLNAAVGAPLVYGPVLYAMNKTHHAFVTEETDGYLVSILKTPNAKAASYVEILVQEGHPLYQRVNTAVNILIVAGTDETVEGVGEMYAPGTYSIVITEDEHNLLKGDKHEQSK